MQAGHAFWLPHKEIFWHGSLAFGLRQMRALPAPGDLTMVWGIQGIVAFPTL
jgi:hypothetical protein